MRFNVVTLFPQFFAESMALGVTGQAVKKGLLALHTVNPRDFTADVHKTVDDRPFGGGDGMIMLAEPLAKAVESIADPGPVVYLSPHGKKWSDPLAREWAATRPAVTLICGRYGGVDQRFINQYVDEEISLGDFVLSGGEPAALAVIDSVARLVPGVLGNSESAARESFVGGRLEHPQFTRPRQTLEQEVPDVLLGGHHSEIVDWQKAVAVAVTAIRRPDLLRTQMTSHEVVRSLERVLNCSDGQIEACGLDRARLNQSLNEWRSINL